MKMKFSILVGLLISTQSLFAQTNTYQWKVASKDGYTYKYVSNDPSKSRFYTLKNGLTVILSPNYTEPKIEFRMAVRAGSNTDPKNATGLAHYLEHLLFKGTDKFGTLDFAKEKPYLDKIDALYEKYNKTTDPEQRKLIYKAIDKVSGEASNYSIANEYDKMMQGLGGNSTNAHTWYEETVYNEDFPANALDKFMALQAERFRNPIFRIFHTELEAVYEEKNRGLDNDGWKLDEAMMDKLFPTHNYGQQTTIGTIEHLKNPSLIEIKKYYHKYYVPNNMAIIFAGDFNPDEMIKKIAKAFSYMVAKPFAAYQPAPEKPLQNVQRIDVYGPSEENINFYYRGYAEGSSSSLMLSLIRNILNNGRAGLFDINLNKQQKVLGADASYQQMKDYGVFSISAKPKKGQTLDDVKNLVLEQIDNLKQGKFDESLLKAIAANNKLAFMLKFDKNRNRAEYLSNTFILNKGNGWAKTLASVDESAKITKAQVVAFANSFFKDNYVIGYKHKGEDKNTIKVEKPTITPINANAGKMSPFVKNILETPLKPLNPKFLDYKKDIQFGQVGAAKLLSVKNTENPIFRMTYRFNLGSYNYPLLQYAANYLPFLGTDKYSAEEISKLFYNIACNYSLNVGTETTTITISGLQDNFGKAVELVEYIFGHVKADEKALAELKSSLLKSRENAKLNKGSIMNALTSYAQFGQKNPFNDVLSNEAISQIKADELIAQLRGLTSFEHEITYYGPLELGTLQTKLQSMHTLPSVFKPIAQAKKYDYAVQDSNRVYFANYDMVQSEIMWLRNTGLYNKDEAGKIEVFNNYFGGGMSSVVFQTIRESKALAYSTFAVYVTPDRADKQNMMIAYVGSQADKMNDAVGGMNELLNSLPKNEKSFVGAKNNIISNYDSQRIVKDAIFANYYADKKLGLDHDSRIEKYKAVKAIDFATINNFHQQKIANKAYSYLIVASNQKVKKEDMAKFGKLKTLSLTELFGY
jgi:predicted Zn-dependent peptidase